MIFSLLLALVAIACGTLLTYLYDEDAPLAARLCTGACTGFAAYALLAFLLASALGLTRLTLVLTGALLLLTPLALMTKPDLRERVRADFDSASLGVRRAAKQPSARSIAYLIFYALFSYLMWLVFDRAMFERDGAIYTGYVNNLGDLPFHLQSIQSFAQSANFPPEDPTYAGARFAYPFMADFLSACFVKAGASLRQSMFLENFVLAVAFAGVLNRWTLKLTRDWIAGLIAPALVFLSGGLGWLLLFSDVRGNDGGLFALLKKLPHDYTIMGQGGWRWGNSITTLLVTQRSILFGLPLAVTVFTQWWLANKKNEEEGKGEDAGKGKRKKKVVVEEQKDTTASNPLSPFHLFPFTPSSKRMLAAGLIAGMLPLVHAHSFIVVMGTGGLTALLLFLTESDRAARMNLVRLWAIFFFFALVISVPEMWFATHGSSAKAGTFLGWEFGWDHGEENVLWFWLKNTGLVIPLIFAAVLWREEKYLIQKSVLLFYLPFTLCFIVPNMMKMAPWVWDNIKVLFYWFVASVPLISLLLARLWRKGGPALAISIVLLIALTLAGALDVWRVVSETTEFQEYDRNGVAIAQKILEVTPERALILHAPTYNPPVFLTGRPSLLGYTGYIWAHGLDYTAREADIKSIYAGATNAETLLARNHVDYILVGPHERGYMPVNDAFFARLQKVGEAGEYRLYKVAK